MVVGPRVEDMQTKTYQGFGVVGELTVQILYDASILE